MVDPANHDEAETTDLSSLRSPQNLRELEHETLELVRAWEGDGPADTEEQSGALHWASDLGARAFVLDLLDAVLRPDDTVVAGKNLARVAPDAPSSLAPRLRSVLRAGATLGVAAPWVAVPLAKRAARSLIAPLVVAVHPSKAASVMQVPAVRHPLRAANRDAEHERSDRRIDSTPALLPLGIPALGDEGSSARLAAAIELLAQNDVERLLLSFESIAATRSLWVFDQTVDEIASSLVPLYDLALPSSSTPAKSITLDSVLFADFELAVSVFENLLDRPQFLALRGGFTVDAALPEALGVAMRLHDWSAGRVARGGAPIELRLVKDAAGQREKAEANIRSWPRATYESVLDIDTNHKRVLDWLLSPDRTDGLRIVVAGGDPYDHAFARCLARRRGLVDRIIHDLPLGTPEHLLRAISGDVGSIVVTTPAVAERELDVAIDHVASWLRRTPVGGQSEWRERFVSSLKSAAEEQALDLVGGGARVPHSLRTQNRAEPGSMQSGASADAGRTPDTDPALAVNREWARRVVARAARSGTLSSGAASENETEVVPESERPLTAHGVYDLIAAVRDASQSWSTRGSEDRASILRRVALSIEADRDLLIELTISESGLAFEASDREVSRAADSAIVAARQAQLLTKIDGATPRPSGIVAVLPSQSSPLAEPVESVLSALAAGCGVIVAAHPGGNRALVSVIDALYRAGVPRDLVRLAMLDEQLTRRLVSDSGVGRVLASRSFADVAALRAWRPELPVIARCEGKNSIIVMPGADLDAAARAIVESAFGDGGHTALHAGLVILVGSVGRSARFRRQLVDAVRSVRAGDPTDPRVRLGALSAPATGSVLDALTVLGPSESWLVEPRRLDDDGRFWAPGLRTGVTTNSAFHLVDTPAPVLGIMRASTLAEAVVLQNAPPFGLAAGLFSHDPDEIEQWLGAVAAGTLTVNGPISTARPGRVPIAGWKRSAVGPATATSGPSALIPLVTWHDEPGTPSSNLSLTGLDDRVAALLDSVTSALDWQQFDRVRRAALSDEQTWREWREWSAASATAIATGAATATATASADSGSAVVRYRPAAVTVRLADGGSLTDLVRVLAAGTLAGAHLVVSSSLKLPRPLRALLKERQVRVFIEADDLWLERVAVVGEGMSRIRLIGGDPRALAEALGGAPDVAVYTGEVTHAGRIELLPFVREQSVRFADDRYRAPMQTVQIPTSADDAKPLTSSLPRPSAQG